MQLSSQYPSIQHHPDDATLMSFAAGSLPDALAVVIAAHCSVCPACQREVKVMERIGGALLSGLPYTAVAVKAPVVAIRAGEADAAGGVPPLAAAVGVGDVPPALRPFIGNQLDAIPWQRFGLGVWHAPVLKYKAGRGDVRLLRVEPGRAMPEHGHGGSELTMILQGAYQDSVGRFGPGDVADLDDDVEHQPVADRETGCICIIASEKQAVFKGFFARLIQPLTGI